VKRYNSGLVYLVMSCQRFLHVEGLDDLSFLNERLLKNIRGKGIFSHIIIVMLLTSSCLRTLEFLSTLVINFNILQRIIMQ
jgi:hypothetical protein